MKLNRLAYLALAVSTMKVSSAFILNNFWGRQQLSDKCMSSTSVSEQSALGMVGDISEDFLLDEYNQWRKQYRKGAFDIKRFRIFKNRYIAIMEANAEAAALSERTGETPPEPIALNEHADRSFEEFQHMIGNQGSEERKPRAAGSGSDWVADSFRDAGSNTRASGLGSSSRANANSGGVTGSFLDALGAGGAAQEDMSSFSPFGSDSKPRVSSDSGGVTGGFLDSLSAGGDTQPKSTFSAYGSDSKPQAAVSDSLYAPPSSSSPPSSRDGSFFNGLGAGGDTQPKQIANGFSSFGSQANDGYDSRQNYDSVKNFAEKEIKINPLAIGLSVLSVGTVLGLQALFGSFQTDGAAGYGGITGLIEEVQYKAKESSREANKIAEERAERRAEEKARLQAQREEKARLAAAADERARIAKEQEAKRLEAEEREARRQSEEKARLLKEEEERIAAEQAKREAEAKALFEAEQEARIAMELLAQRQAEEAMRMKALEQARNEAKLRSEESVRRKADEVRVKTDELVKFLKEKDSTDEGWARADEKIEQQLKLLYQLGNEIAASGN